MLGCFVLLSCGRGRTDTVFASLPGGVPVSLHRLTVPSATCAPGWRTLFCPLVGPPRETCSYGLVHVTTPPPAGPPDCASLTTTAVWFPVPPGPEYWFAVDVTDGTRRVTVGNGSALVEVHHLDDAGIFATHMAFVPKDAGLAVLSDPGLWDWSFLLVDRDGQARVWERMSRRDRFELLRQNVGTTDADDWWFWFDQLEENDQRVLMHQVLDQFVSDDGGVVVTDDTARTLDRLAEHANVLPDDFSARAREVFRRTEAPLFELLLTVRGDDEAGRRSCARLANSDSWASEDLFAALVLGGHRCAWVASLARASLGNPDVWCADEAGEALCTVDAARQVAHTRLARMLPDAGQAQFVTSGPSALRAVLALNEPLPADVERQLARAAYRVEGEGCTTGVLRFAAGLPAEVTEARWRDEQLCRVFIDDVKHTVRVEVVAARRGE